MCVSVFQCGVSVCVSVWTQCFSLESVCVSVPVWSQYVSVESLSVWTVSVWSQCVSVPV